MTGGRLRHELDSRDADHALAARAFGRSMGSDEHAPHSGEIEPPIVVAAPASQMEVSEIERTSAHSPSVSGGVGAELRRVLREHDDE